MGWTGAQPAPLAVIPARPRALGALVLGLVGVLALSACAPVLRCVPDSQFLNCKGAK